MFWDWQDEEDDEQLSKQIKLDGTPEPAVDSSAISVTDNLLLSDAQPSRPPSAGPPGRYVCHVYLVCSFMLCY